MIVFAEPMPLFRIMLWLSIAPRKHPS